MAGLTSIDIIVLVTYFVIVALIGIVSSRLIKNREDFLMGSRRFGKAMTIMFSFGAGTHADNAVGVAAQSYKVGLAGIWYQWIMVFTLPVYWLLAPIFRRARVLTTADFFEHRFGRQVMLLYSVFALYVTVSFTAVMLYGSGKLIEALTGGMISWQWAIVVIASISFLYGIVGGLIAAVWNDFFQGLLTIVMSLMIIPFFWDRIGGLEQFQNRLPDAGEVFKLVLSKDMTIYWIAMMTIQSLVSMVTQPHIMPIAAAAKTEMDSRVGFVGGMVVKRLMTVPWALTGVMAIALFGSGTIDPDHVFGTMSRELLPQGFVGLMLACVMASVMDNCAVNMLTSAGIYTNSIHKRFLPGSTSEQKLLKINRIAAVCFAVVSMAMSFLFTDVTSAMRFLWQTVPIMGIPFFLGLLWRRANRYGVFASFIAALSATASAQFYFGWRGDAGLPNTIALFLTAGLGAGVVVSMLTPPEPRWRLDRFFLLIKTPIGQEHVLREAGFKEIPGTGTFEMPSEHETESSGLDLRSWLQKIDRRQSRVHAARGFAVMSLITLAMLAGVTFLAQWLSGA